MSNHSRNHLTAVGTIIGAEDGPCYLADMILQSLPPQVGSGIEVKALDITVVPNLQRQGREYWTDRPVQLNGHIEDGVLIAEVLMIDGRMIWRAERLP